MKTAALFRPRRELGRTGFRATRIGIGDIADRRLPGTTLVGTLHRAMEAGLNVIDTAPMYEDGYSEEIVGAAVHHWRDRVFVIDKVDRLTEPIMPQVEASLRRLGLEAVDLFLLHALDGMANWRRATLPGGALDGLDRAVKAGKCRFRGISSHDPDVLLAAITAGACDVVLLPLGASCDLRFEDEVLPLARRRGVGTLAMKAFGAGKLLGDTEGYNQPLKNRPRGKLSSGGRKASGEPLLPRLTVQECLNYTLTCDADVTLLGLSYPNEQDAAFRAARGFRKLSPKAMAAVRRRAEEAMAGKGRVWWNQAEK
ncbi:MAG TPA: aldo/keto reductase [Planctomycetota bacterium]|nr:aldo/keto reductase [Planctomycetota bacterium]